MSSDHNLLISKRRKLTIVFEENGSNDGKGFNVSMQGDCERVGHLPNEQLQPAEFWGGMVFTVAIGMLKKAGIIVDPPVATPPTLKLSD